jgi:hypothetical protein
VVLFATDKTIKTKNMKVYFARPINLYKTPQDERDLLLLKNLNLDVINPDKEELQKRYKEEGMSVFIQAMQDCDVLAFRSFPDLKISAGVKKEIDEAIEKGKIIFELPTITENRCLSVEDTRSYLKYLGNR